MLTLADLPPELYTHVLEFVETPLLSSTTLALSRAVPRSPVPQYHMFTHVRLTRKGQLLSFYLRIRGLQGEDARKYVKSFELQEWKFDPDVLINALQLLPHATSILIWIGYNCAPEHIAEIFARQAKPELQNIVLRFRTWTDHANYLPFLKGSYYDSTFEGIARSPPPKLARFSIVQDVPSRDLFDHPDDDDAPSGAKVAAPSTLALLSPALRRNFAPPIVLFSTSCLSSLTSSPSILGSLKHLRLRFPQRQILGHLYPMPNLELLDLSSTTFSPADLRLVFIKFPNLKHLVVDHTGFFLAAGRDGAADACREAGRMCAMWGVGRAREVEREAKDWFARQHVARKEDESDDGSSDQGPAAGPQTAIPAHLRPTKKGRRGIASATISLRDRPASSSMTPATRSSTAEQTTRRMHVLPPLPALRTFSLGASDPSITPAVRAEWTSQFAEGWQEGKRRLADFAKRHRPKPDVHVYLLRPSTLSLPSSIPSCLEEVTEKEWERYTRQSVEDVSDDPPVFCTVPDADCGVPARRGFGGGRRKKEADGEGEVVRHLDGCGHMAGKDIWNE